MSDVTIIRNGVLITNLLHPRVITQGAIAWRADRIVYVGADNRLASLADGARSIDARGGLIMPGFINLHHHFYSALARGLDPGTRLNNFTEVLDRFWWRLDRALDRDAIRASALLSAADCIRWGCTTVFDHHASPSAINGSLRTIADAVQQAGLSALLCYEVTDRNGHLDALAGIDENLHFFAAQESHPRIRGTVGLHASFTLRDETLAAVAANRPRAAGCHIHAGEDLVDVERSLSAFGCTPVQRLAAYGLLDERCLLAHGIHLQSHDLDAIATHGATIIHNPESNANNGVGYLDPGRVTNHGCRVGLGTDGMSSSVLRAARAAFLNHRAARRDPSAGFEILPQLFGTNVHVARRFFGEPQLGELASGAPADVIVVDMTPATPIDATNVFAHLMYGATESGVRHTVARGQLLLDNYRHTTIDAERLTSEARKAAVPMWQRFAELHWGTPFLGERG